MEHGGRKASCRKHGNLNAEAGFTLIEILIAAFILAFGLMASGQLIYMSLASASLARSKGSAAIVAQGKMDQLAALYRRDALDQALNVGDHGPETVEITNPFDNSILNRYLVYWEVSSIPDPRPGKVLRSRRVDVTVVPADAVGNRHVRALLNKVVTASTIFSPRRL